jgi:hypothetical protein
LDAAHRAVKHHRRGRIFTLSSAIFLGAYFGAGFGLEHGSNVSSTALHIGAEVQYHFVPEAGADPWVGYGLGYESLSQDSSSYYPDQDKSLSGTAVHSWVTLGVRGTLMP